MAGWGIKFVRTQFSKTKPFSREICIKDKPNNPKGKCFEKYQNFMKLFHKR